MKPKTLWYLSEFVIFLFYAIVGYGITNSIIASLFGASIFVVLPYLVRKALDKVEIEKK